MISIIMLNWGRPHYVSQLTGQYQSYKNVGKIYVVNENFRPSLPQTDKVVLIESSQPLGLYWRYAVAALLPSDPVMFLDDDQEFPEESIDTLYEAWKRDPQIIHGAQGRTPGGHYAPTGVVGPCEIVLTCGLITSRRYCSLALVNSLQFEDLPCVPRGNGEDIVLSYTAIAQSHRYNHAWPVAFRTLPDVNDTAISVRFPKHYDHRTLVMQRCRNLLQGVKIEI